MPRALIIGGGPAGSAAAISLAQAGVRPHLIERHRTAPAGVCGGFLGWDAIAGLRELGVDPWALGARPITRFRLSTRDRCVEATLPATAGGISRRTLDNALLKAAEQAGTIVSLGRTARAIDPAERRVRFDDGEESVADALFLSVGKHELRGVGRDFSSTSVGLRTTLPPSDALHDALRSMVELHLFDRGYAGLLLQEDGSANLCLSVSTERLTEAGSIPALMTELQHEAPLLRARLEGPATRFDAVAGVPYGWRASATHSGLFRTGDQSAVIASLAGDGIAIALASGASAARAMLTGGPDAAPAWQRAWRKQCNMPVGIAEALRYSAATPLPRSLLMTVLKFAPALGTSAAAFTRIRKV